MNLREKTKKKKLELLNVESLKGDFNFLAFPLCSQNYLSTVRIKQTWWRYKRFE